MTDEPVAAHGNPASRESASSLDGQPFSGIQRHLGFRITEWRDEHAVIELEVGPHLLNRSGVVHGGIIALLIDAVCGHAACYCPYPGRIRTAATLSVTTSYIAAARRGPLRAVGRLRGGGRKIFIASAEVFDADDKLVAVGECTCKYEQGSEMPEGRPLQASES